MKAFRNIHIHQYAKVEDELSFEKKKRLGGFKAI